MAAVYLLLMFVGLYGSTHSALWCCFIIFFCKDKCFKLGSFVSRRRLGLGCHCIASKLLFWSLSGHLISAATRAEVVSSLIK